MQTPSPADLSLPAIRPDSKLVASITKDIDLNDRAAIAVYGDSAQRSVGEFADRILAETRNKELGKTGELLSDILLKAKELDPAQAGDTPWLLRLFTSARAQLERFKAKFDTVASQIDRISLELDRHRDQLRRDVALLDDLHVETKKSITFLDAHVEAAKSFAESFRGKDLIALKQSADSTGKDGLLEAQRYQDAVQALDRLEKRIFYLQQARQIGIQQLPQIRIVQAGDETLIENLQATSNITIPVWKQKMIILLGLAQQKDALDMQKAVTDATNEMLKQATEMMKGQAVSIEEQAQRGIVDTATLEKTNSDLIETIKSVLKVQEEGRRKRAEAEQAMQRMTADLNKTLSESMATR